MIVHPPMRVEHGFHVVPVEYPAYIYGMSETFSEGSLELQKDPGYFNPQKLEKLKIVFDRVCQQMGITGIEQGQRSRDKLATIVLIGSNMYPDDNELVNAAITAMNLPSVTATSE